MIPKRLAAALDRHARAKKTARLAEKRRAKRESERQQAERIEAHRAAERAVNNACDVFAWLEGNADARDLARRAGSIGTTIPLTSWVARDGTATTSPWAGCQRIRLNGRRPILHIDHVIEAATEHRIATTYRELAAVAHPAVIAKLAQDIGMNRIMRTVLKELGRA